MGKFKKGEKYRITDLSQDAWKDALKRGDILEVIDEDRPEFTPIDGRYKGERVFLYDTTVDALQKVNDQC